MGAAGVRRPISLARRRGLGARVADANCVFAGAQTFAQGVARGLSPAVRILEPAADLLEGRRVIGAATPLGRVMGRAAAAVGRAGPLFNVAASCWDTYRAYREDEPRRKRVAVLTAALSWIGTLMVIGGVIAGATPLGIGLAAGAAAIAGFQLVDAFLFGQAATRFLAGSVPPSRDRPAPFPALNSA